MSDVSSRGLRPRGPGYVFSALAGTLLLLVGVVALDASQPPPPTVAEFAPAALDQITDPPPRQGSDVGSGEGGQGGGGSSGSPTPSPTAAPPTATRTPTGPEVPRTRDCVEGRQIEDPQSPPCVPGWQGDNGGATAFGITGDEIRVAAPYGTFLTGDPSPQWQALVSFFNQRFELYGRKIRLLTFPATGDNFAHPVPADMISDATYVVQEAKAFASLGYPDRKGAEQTYYDELARKKVVAVIGRETAKATEAHLAKHHPYLWTRGTAVDAQFRSYGQHVCQSWAGRPPRYGGPWAFPTQPAVRKIAVLVNEAADGSKPDIQPLLDNLAACDVRPFVQTAPVPKQQGDGVNPMLQMADEEVTTIVCVCTTDGSREYLAAAEAQGYHPEWLMGTYVNNDLDNSFSTSPPAQTRNVFGITFWDKVLPVRDTWWYTAIRQGNPSMTPPDKMGPISTYQSLLLLASGIQLAGPNLTPQTFADALHRTQFPNPGAAGPPYYQARVGFPNGTHSMRLDAAMYWYDITRTGNSDPTNQGRVCLVRKGPRYQYGQWSKEEPPYHRPEDC